MRKRGKDELYIECPGINKELNIEVCKNSPCSWGTSYNKQNPGYGNIECEFPGGENE